MKFELEVVKFNVNDIVTTSVTAPETQENDLPPV